MLMYFYQKVKNINHPLKKNSMSKIIHFFLLVLFYACFNFSSAQTKDPQGVKTSDVKNNALQTNQPVIVIDASKLLNTPKNNQPQSNSPALQTNSTPASNNLRIGSSGQYIDNSKTEQLNSKGQICTSESGKKTCN